MNAQRFSLDGDWQLAYAPEGRFQIEHPDDLDAAGMEVIPARVPGNVELDLVRAGCLPDPFYADQIYQSVGLPDDLVGGSERWAGL